MKKFLVLGMTVFILSVLMLSCDNGSSEQTYSLQNADVTSTEWGTMVEQGGPVIAIEALIDQPWTKNDFNAAYLQLSQDNDSLNLKGKTEAQLRAMVDSRVNKALEDKIMKILKQQGWVIYALPSNSGGQYADIIAIKKE